MSNVAIKAENLSKAYQLGEIGTGTISRDLERWVARLRGKEDPFLRIGETNDRTSKGNSNVVWSLKDISFEVQQGDAVGIIGRNGAGKSTLLKILSKVTSPTTGRISGKGRIASLLEVGTGFHPELTGRENIYLNGAILGMRKKEISKKFDEIVDFAGIERYIDTPVKRYSSGMYVRLAFAVAAHLESEILIVDEVLAVGDAEFQKKCLGKMGDVSTNEGRTVLFVSHNLGSIKQLCNRGLLLQNGQITGFGETDSILHKYNEALSAKSIHERLDDSQIFFTSFSYRFENSRPDQILITIGLYSEITFETVSIDFRLKSKLYENIGFGSLGVFDKDKLVKVNEGNNEFCIAMPINYLAIGNYYLSVDITIPNIEYLVRAENCLLFEIHSALKTDYLYLSQDLNYGSVHIPLAFI